MVDAFRFNFDFSGIEKGLEKLQGEVAEAVARSGALAGAQVIRDEARIRAPVYTPKPGQRVNENAKPGQLKDSIYVAYAERRSSKRLKTYSVSWNAKKAPHGHLVEFGHWLVIKGKRIRRIPGKSFLRAAYEARLQKARDAAITRMRERWAELMKG